VENLIEKMNAVQIKEMMILNFIKDIPETQISRLTSKSYVADVFVKFMIMRRVFSDIAPQNNLAGLLVHVQ
jgi:hypothetical protein